VERSALTFRVAAEEAARLNGEFMPLDINPASRGRFGITRRFPAGPVAGISPFNLPLSLAAHKVAPAMAVGAPIVLKVPSAAPLTMLAVARLIEEAGALPGSVSVMPMSRQLGDRMVTDERFKVLSFTGSPAVGWDMKARAGKKKVVLELGGNAGAIVDASADVAWAAQRCAAGAFKYAGQTCISVQRIFVHEQVWGEFTDQFVSRAAALRVGDPADPATDLGPMIDEAAAARIEDWVASAVADGGRILLGGQRDGATYPPTVLVDVPDTARVCRDEAFAPVAVLSAVADFDEAIARVNDSDFGLQAGVFTSDVWNSWRAFERLEVGGVVLNDSPTYRVDHMPYGGVKDSGLGREGIRYAMEDMTELRLFVVAMPS
jgi:glyceraldehyde-3-phosphate dehydrogenase (NADP+)